MHHNFRWGSSFVLAPFLFYLFKWWANGFHFKQLCELDGHNLSIHLSPVSFQLNIRSNCRNKSYQISIEDQSLVLVSPLSHTKTCKPTKYMPHSDWPRIQFIICSTLNCLLWNYGVSEIKSWPPHSYKIKLKSVSGMSNF